MSDSPEEKVSFQALEELTAEPVQSFAVFAAERNFTHAADALHIAMPSLHRKINKLQKQLGVELYLKNGNELTITEAGKRLARYANDARHLASEAAAELLGIEATPMRIAAGRGGFLWVIADAVANLSHRPGGIKVETAKNAEAIELLETGAVDIAVLAYDAPPDQLCHQDLENYAQTLVVRSDHGLAQRESVSIASLDGLKFALPERGTVMRNELARAFRSAGASLHVEAEAIEWDVLVAFVTFGIEATIVNEFVPVPDGYTKIPIIDLRPAPYYSAWRPERQTLADEFNESFNNPNPVKPGR